MNKATEKKKHILNTDIKIRLIAMGVIILGIIVSALFSKSADGTMSGTEIFLIGLLGVYGLYIAWWFLRKKFAMTKAGAFIISSGAFTLLCIFVTIFSTNALLTVLAVIFLMGGILCLGCSAAYEIVRRNTQRELIKDKELEHRQAERYVDTVAPEVKEQDDFSMYDEYGSPLDENGDGTPQDL